MPNRSRFFFPPCEILLFGWPITCLDSSPPAGVVCLEFSVLEEGGSECVYEVPTMGQGERILFTSDALRR